MDAAWGDKQVALDTRLPEGIPVFKLEATCKILSPPWVSNHDATDRFPPKRALLSLSKCLDKAQASGHDARLPFRGHAPGPVSSQLG